MGIFPSLMAADPLNLESVIDRLQSHCAGFHIDVIDNNFAPNLTWGASTINAIAQKVGKNIWVHLMVDSPDTFYETLFLEEQSLVSFHVESKIDILKLIKRIKEKKQRVSIAISPKTAVNEIIPFLHVIDHVLVMSVEPGFSGQSFLPEALLKIDEVGSYRYDHQLPFFIGVDGGITISNIEKLVIRGVDDYAIAGAIFNTTDPIATLKELNYIVEVNKKTYR